MDENVVRVLELYDSDETLRKRIEDAEAAYPGSLEIRDAVIEAVLLPVARELGLPFTLRDLRVYESVMSAKRCPDEEMTEEELSESGEYSYWFNGRGWSYDKNLFGE